MLLSYKTFSVSVLALCLAGCQLQPTQPNYQADIDREQALIEQWQTEQQSNAVALTSDASLTDLLKSDELTGLLNEAYSNNPSLQTTWLSLQIRKQQLTQAEAGKAVDLTFENSAQRIEAEGNTFTSSLALDWPIDLWGQLDDSIAAALNDVKQQDLLYEQAKNTLTAEIMNAWLNLVALQQAIVIQDEFVDSLSKNEVAILNRYRNGLGTLEDLDAARSSLASAQATQAAYNYNLRQQQRDLNTLVGRVDGGQSPIANKYPDVVLSLAELPEQSLATRADLQAAFYALQAAEKRTDVAYKTMLPSFNLGASLSQTGASLSDVLLGSPLWSVLTQLSAPILNGGNLASQAKQTEFETAQAYQAYRDTLLSAVNEVEQALDQEQSLTTQLDHTQRALNNQLNNVAQYEQRYRQGLVDILDVLSTQQTTFDLRAQLNDLTYQRLANRINLGLALGLGVAH
jgi:outer membrane protein TolC